jgi:hypothetical protein
MILHGCMDIIKLVVLGIVSTQGNEGACPLVYSRTASWIQCNALWETSLLRGVSSPSQRWRRRGVSNCREFKKTIDSYRPIYAITCQAKFLYSY